MNDTNRNTILAVILSGLVLIAWQYFYNVPQMEKQRAAQQAQSELAKTAPGAGTAAAPSTTTQASAPHRQRFAERRGDRRSVAGAVAGGRRSLLASDRAVFAVGHGESVLR